MIAIIRIKGMVGIRKDIEDALYRLRLRRKYTCVVVEESPEILGVLKKIRDYVAYGKIDGKTYEELIEKRGKKDTENQRFSVSPTSKKRQEVGDKEGKLKPFFRLHPPRGGIKSKLHYPKGVLGDNKEKINELIRRML